MNDVTLVLPEELSMELGAMAAEKLEIAAVLLAGVVRDPAGRIRILGREIHIVRDEHCVRASDGMEVSSLGWAPAVARAQEIGATPIWVHSHPGGNPTPSRHDDVVDTALAAPFRIRSESELYASLIVSPGRDNAPFTFSGRVYDGDEEETIGRLLSVGQRIHLFGPFESIDEAAFSSAYDRQVRAFGGDVQNAIGHLRIGVVGVGGTGSAVLEQLSRLGAKDVLICDPDVLSLANTTRVFGSAPDQQGQTKIAVAQKHLERIAPQVSLTAIQGSANDEAVARALAGRDVIFGCTDDDAGRMVLSRLSSFMLIPVIDCGVLIDSDQGIVNGIHARVTVMSPGYACLLCRRRVDPTRAAAELRLPDEQARLAREGYAPELGRVEPAVVAYTSLVASLAVGEMLERLVGYGPDPAPSELLFRIHERELSTNTRAPKESHYCHPVDGRLGVGESQPFLQQTWRS